MPWTTLSLVFLLRLIIEVLSVEGISVEGIEGRYWMKELREHLIDIPLVELAIPGSHNSAAYWLDESGPVASDEAEFIKRLVSGFPFAKGIVKKYSVCQHLDVLGQLNAGVRWVDIRAAYLNKNNNENGGNNNDNNNNNKANESLIIAVNLMREMLKQIAQKRSMKKIRNG